MRKGSNKRYNNRRSSDGFESLKSFYYILLRKQYACKIISVKDEGLLSFSRREMEEVLFEFFEYFMLMIIQTLWGIIESINFAWVDSSQVNWIVFPVMSKFDDFFAAVYTFWLGYHKISSIKLFKVVSLWLVLIRELVLLINFKNCFFDLDLPQR